MTQIRNDNYFDTKANGYALRCFCITMAAFFISWLMNQVDIFIVDKRIMNRGVCMALALFIICLIFCKIYGLDRKNTKYVLIFFIIAITTVIEIMLTYHTVLLSVIPLVYSSMYRNTKKMMIYTYALTVVSIIIIVFGGYHFGLCDANMALLTSKPLASYISENGLFNSTQINSNTSLTLALYFVFPRCVLCGVFVPICLNISDIITKSRMREEEMRVLAEIDGMTGLYNKSKYLELVSNPYSMEEQIAVIFWDVNGLKKINDTCGHEYGDKLILTISECILRMSSATEKAYRVGGDEFVMILRGADEAAVQKKLQLWQKEMDGKTIGNAIPVTASFGYACGAGSQLEQLIKQADERMYENKREFYRNEK